MVIPDDIKLDEDEDVFDIVIRLEKSFAIKFEKDAFTDIKTFGDLCDVIESYIRYDSKEDCTRQQAFYKIRTAISNTQQIDKKLITPDTRLVSLFPRHSRRRQVKLFQKQLGVNLKFLTYPGWLSLVLVGGLLASFIAFFFDWKIAVTGIAFFTIALNIADKLGKDLAIETVKELTVKATTEHYIAMRSTKLTVNRNEILDIIKDCFINELAINKEQLTRDAKFSWA
ncbi:MAG TPA: acyl carrier protein [Chitinophagaceae bacterium]|nr:acyl carrier protein [Chitinophagaceae bacterium]